MVGECGEEDACYWHKVGLCAQLYNATTWFSDKIYLFLFDTLAVAIATLVAASTDPILVMAIKGQGCVQDKDSLSNNSPGPCVWPNYPV